MLSFLFDSFCRNKMPKQEGLNYLEPPHCARVMVILGVGTNFLFGIYFVRKH